MMDSLARSAVDGWFMDEAFASGSQAFAAGRTFPGFVNRTLHGPPLRWLSSPSNRVLNPEPARSHV